MRSTSALLPFALVAITACTSSSTPDDSGPPPDAAMEDGAAGDAGSIDGGAPADGGGGMDSGPSDAGGCGPECPPGFCSGGVCTFSCCDFGDCGPGFVCDWGSCGCVPATGCCATGTCPGAGEFCWDDCTCVSGDDCRIFGCRDVGFVCDFATGTCSPDTSCGDCGPDRVCAWGTCTATCALGTTTCPEGLVCSATEGCIAPRCTDAECAAYEPPQRCDPEVGCYDPCARDDWSWCTAMGGFCYLGSCIDDTCSGSTGIGCHYRYDCCGNAVCTRDDRPDPSCGPCTGEAYVPPREDLCRCASGSGECIDTWGGGIVVPPEPWPGRPPG